MNLYTLANGDLQLGDWKYRIDLKSTLIIYINTYRCNFNCPTCIGWHTKGQPDSLVARHGSQRVSDAFRELAEKSEHQLCILFTGGEPTLQVDFVDFIEKLTTHASVIIHTNLCTPDIQEFANRIDPKQVAGIEASFHFCIFDHNQKLERTYFENFRLLMDSGFSIVCKIYAVPWELPPSSKFTDRLSEIKKQLPGVILYVSHFIGPWKGRSYPFAYNEKQREFLNQILTIRKSEQLDLIHRAKKFEGMLCDAGRGIGLMKCNGDFFRCLTEKVPLGNLLGRHLRFLSAPKSCPHEICACPPCGALWFGFQPWKFSPGAYGKTPRLYNRFVANNITSVKELNESLRFK